MLTPVGASILPSPPTATYGWAGADYGVWGKGVIEAIDYQTGKIRWSHDVGKGGSGAGVLTTASGLTFTGDAYGNVLALNTADGETLWHAGTGGSIDSSPIAYEIDGRQVILTSSGSVLFAWSLPQREAAPASAAIPAKIPAHNHPTSFIASGSQWTMVPLS